VRDRNLSAGGATGDGHLRHAGRAMQRELRLRKRNAQRVFELVLLRRLGAFPVQRHLPATVAADPAATAAAADPSARLCPRGGVPDRDWLRKRGVRTECLLVQLHVREDWLLPVHDHLPELRCRRSH